jgi:uncharacterized oxidoreductase
VPVRGRPRPQHTPDRRGRAQLDGTGVEVSELVPPAVATTPDAKQRNPRALDLADFAAEVMDLLQPDPTPHEILVKGVLMHRWAERDGTYDELVAQRSQALAMLPSRQWAIPANNSSCG